MAIRRQPVDSRDHSPTLAARRGWWGWRRTTCGLARSPMTPVRFALGLAAAVLAAGCSADTADLQPLQWQKVPGSGPGGAVLGFGSPGSFDERGNFTISAFKEGDVFSSGEISPLATRLDLGPG